MKRSIRHLTLFVFGGALASCALFSSRRGPIDQENARLEAAGSQLKSDGEKMLSEGISLQNRSKEMRILVEDKRRRAVLLESQGDAAGANQLRLDANSQEAEATSSDSRGREMEARGRELIVEGQENIDRGRSLQEQGDRIDRE